MKLVPYIKAGYSILYLVTSEESRAEREVFEAAKELNRLLKVWSCTEGFIDPTNDKKRDQEEDAIAALNKMRGDNTTNIFIAKDLHAFMQNYKVLRLLRDIARDFKQQMKTLIIISPVKKLPPDIDRDITIIEFELPKKEEISTVFTTLFDRSKKAIERKTTTGTAEEKEKAKETLKNLNTVDEDEVERITQAAMGLTITEAENAFAKAIVESKNDKSPISKLVMSEKANTVKKSGILEYFEAKQTIDDIGGLDNLKKWLLMRQKAFSKKAREFGLPMPRGIMLVGLPGAGKSLTAKAVSNILGVPLLKFDVGRVFGGLVGESESNMRTAIQTAEAVGNCVLWIDEMEKAFAGMSGSGTTDGGTSQRVFGSFITWMQEKISPVFIVATVNRLENLPPELLRKGRFDEIFFLGLPSDKEKEEILKIHIKKFGRKPENFKKLKDCVDASVGFSGAELEEAIISGLYNAFDKNKELTTNDILDAITTTVPLSKMRETELNAMLEWAADNAVNASKIENKNNKLSSGRQLEM